MDDEDDIESFWEGIRPPPKPFKERVRESIETGLKQAENEEALRQAILQRRLGEVGRRRLALDIEEIRNQTTEVEVSNRLSPVGRAVQQERRVETLLRRVEQGTGDPIDPEYEDLYALSEGDTQAHLEGLRHFLAALGFPARVELSPDTGTIYVHFPPSLNAEIHLGQFVPTASQRPGETTISIER